MVSTATHEKILLFHSCKTEENWGLGPVFNYKESTAPDKVDSQPRQVFYWTVKLGLVALNPACINWLYVPVTVRKHGKCTRNTVLAQVCFTVVPLSHYMQLITTCMDSECIVWIYAWEIPPHCFLVFVVGAMTSVKTRWSSPYPPPP